ncbi:MAG: DUF222 domain-containing protein [Actinobacteria bacterium]|nr:DUF222 domain-containing protein [Actinomycetota bacterium]
MQGVAPASVADALARAEEALGFLAGADWASLPGQVQQEALEELAHLQTRHVAARTGALAAFDAGNGYRFDGCAGPVPWLTSVTRVSRAAAKEQAGWLRTFRCHPRIADALAAGTVTDSYARAFAAWTGRLPGEDRDAADEILLDAAAAGLPWDDIARLAQEMYERSRTGPDRDDGPFRDRGLRLERTLGGAGRLTADLSPQAAELLRKALDALGKRLGPDDLRSQEERDHDALAEAISRLLKANLVPRSSGMDTKVMVNVTLAQLRQLPGSAALEDAWIEARCADAGYLTGPGAAAAACAAELTPVVTGHVDPDALNQLTSQWLAGAGPGGNARGCTCGGCTCRELLAPQARDRLSRTLLRLAADTLSGPEGLAAYLRSRQLGAPFSGASLPLDIGDADTIPEYLRRAVIRRDQCCAWPGCGKPPAACEPHHLIPRSAGGETSLGNLKLFCWFHHHVCIHRDRWQVTVHADGTVTARAPWGTELRTHQPPARAA